MGAIDFSYLMNAHEKQLKLKCSVFDLFTLDSKERLGKSSFAEPFFFEAKYIL